MPLLRRIFFYLFAAVYVVGCPLLIAYSLGYLFKPDSGRQVVKTGLIAFATAPEGASITLKGRPLAERTPSLVRDLLPGDYPVELFLQGYEPWKRTVSVEAEKAVSLEKVLLLPQEWKPERVLEGPLLDLLPIPGNGALLLHAPAAGGGNFLWVEPGPEKTRVQDLTVLLPPDPWEILRDPDQGRELFVLGPEEGLSRIDLDSGMAETEFKKGVRGAGLLRGRLYLLREGVRFQRTGLNGKGAVSLLEDRQLGEALFGEEGLFRIRVLSPRLFLFLGERGELLCNRLPYRLVESGVLGAEPDSSGKRALIWQKGRIGVIDFSDAQEESLFERGPRPRWLFARGVEIRQAFWVFDGSHILFRDGSRLFLLDLQAGNPAQPVFLLQARRGSSVVYSEEKGRLYYLDPETGSLCFIELLPRGGP